VLNLTELLCGTIRKGTEDPFQLYLDIAFDEDHQRVRKDNGPANFSVLRHIALNLLKQDKTAKAGIKAKHLKAGWDEPYLLKVLFGQRNSDAIALTVATQLSPGWNQV
jgi:hypothetical protein